MRAIVLCPTPTGGHIEHAANLAVALSEIGIAEVELISRAEAATYLSSRLWERVMLSSLPRVSGGAGVRFVREWRFIGKHLREIGDRSIVILEEPRFPLPERVRRRNSVVLIVHNAREHSRVLASIPNLARFILRSVSLMQADRIIVHGLRQKERLGAWRSIREKTIASRLPGLGPADVSAPVDFSDDGSGGSRFVLSIGELRDNKNIEEAVRASGLSGIPLVVAGQEITRGYANFLQNLAADLRAPVTLREGFLTAQEFGQLLAECVAVVLPYGRFEAQSGVLERALAAGRPVIMSDLPALAEQAGGRQGVWLYEAGSVEALASRFHEVVEQAPRVDAATRIDPDWLALAHAAVDGLWSTGRQ